MSERSFLDNNQYVKSGVKAYEFMFGEGFISPGRIKKCILRKVLIYIVCKKNTERYRLLSGLLKKEASVEEIIILILRYFFRLKIWTFKFLIQSNKIQI